jgi:D-aminopeptidase
MKIYISADIEGTTGIVNWDETHLDNANSKYFREQMTREVNAACQAAVEAGAGDILVKDAHGPARNIDPSGLPKNVRIMRGWTRDPFVMMAGIDSSFDGVMFTGYHSEAGSNGNPLAHTMDTMYQYIRINGENASEFLINSYIAAYYNVPVLFLCGDRQLCESVKKLNKNIKTVAVSEGIGNASISINPDLAVERIKQTALEALNDDRDKYIIKLPEKFKVEIHYNDHYLAYKAGFFPGAVHTGAKTVEFESNDYMDVLKFFLFVL